jgi:hypothetical protein
VSRASLDGWIWYLRGLPQPARLADRGPAAIRLLGAAWRPTWRLPARDAGVPRPVVPVGLPCCSRRSDLKDLRFTMPILFPGRRRGARWRSTA